MTTNDDRLETFEKSYPGFTVEYGQRYVRSGEETGDGAIADIHWLGGTNEERSIAMDGDGGYMRIVGPPIPIPGHGAPHDPYVVGTDELENRIAYLHGHKSPEPTRANTVDVSNRSFIIPITITDEWVSSGWTNRIQYVVGQHPKSTTLGFVYLQLPNGHPWLGHVTLDVAPEYGTGRHYEAHSLYSPDEHQVVGFCFDFVGSIDPGRVTNLIMWACGEAYRAMPGIGPIIHGDGYAQALPGTKAQTDGSMTTWTKRESGEWVSSGGTTASSTDLAGYPRRDVTGVRK